MRLIFLLLVTTCSSMLTNSQTVFTEKGRYGVRSNTGDIIVKARYDYIPDFKQGYTTVEKKKLKGLMDSAGTIITAPAYDYISEYNQGYFNVKKGDFWGLVNKWGKETISPTYQTVHHVQPYDLFYVQLNRRYGLFTGEGKVLLEPIYYNQVVFEKVSGVSTISNTYGYGMVDTTGKILIPVRFDELYIRGSLAWAKKNYKWGLFDLKGKELLPAEYSDIVALEKDLLVAIKDKKYYFFNSKVERPTAYVYDMAYKFTEGFGKVKRNNKFGFIDIKGNEVIPCQYDSTDIFRNGKAWVKKGEKEFYIGIPTGDNHPANMSVAGIKDLADQKESFTKSNLFFNSNALAAMAAKASDNELYKKLLQETAKNTAWKKKERVENNKPGIAFLLFSGATKTAEIFFSEADRFCYYNNVVTAAEHSAAVQDLKANNFTLKSKKQGNSVKEDWEKAGIPYKVTLQYNEGETSASMALIALSCLKKNT